MKKHIKRKSKYYEWQRLAESGTTHCSCGSSAQLSVDHIVPQWFLKDLGLFDEVYEDEANFEILCRSCNHRKGGHIQPSQKVFQLLEKYIKKSQENYGIKTGEV